MTLSLRSPIARTLLASAPLVLMLALSACTTEKIVEVERPPFNPPADAASGFLGYYTVGAKQTTCGNCHADFQASWATSDHAKAYATLKANPGAQSFCYSCHTITERGNSATGKVGHDKVTDSTYYDVQCESCHGPGQAHVQGVNAGNIVRPLAQIGIGPDTSASCAACHNGTHHPYVEQWSKSRHAIADDHMNTNPSCVKCHESRGRIAIWDEQTNYKEKGVATAAQPVATCATCHDPHGSEHDGQLRRSVSDPEPSNNLCMGCHLYRIANTPSSSRGNMPHGPQGGVLLGFGGWRPPNFELDTARIYGSHATGANKKLCAGCHVGKFSITDATGTYNSVGHLFEAAPCVDGSGRPTGNDDCAFTAAARNWSSCTTSGCHANATAAASAFNSAKSEMKLLGDILWTDKNANQVIDVTDDGYLPRIKANTTDLNPSNATVTAADGMELNVRICGEKLDAHPDGSYGTHNKFLCTALLAQGGVYLRSIYPFLAAPPANVQAIWDRWSQPSTVRGVQVKREKFPSLD